MVKQRNTSLKGREATWKYVFPVFILIFSKFCSINFIRCKIVMTKKVKMSMGAKKLGLNTAQLTSLVIAVIVDVILAVVLILGYNVVLAPTWGGQKQIEQYFAIFLGTAILLAPTLLILKYGWKDKITSAAYRLPLRFAFGAFFLKASFDKLLNPDFFSSPGALSFFMSGNPNTFLQQLFSFPLNNEVVFLSMVAVGELFVGIALLLGIFTRLGGLTCTIMLMANLFAYGYSSSSVYGINLWGAIAGFTLAMNRSGRYFGLDQFLGPRLEESNNRLARILGLILT
jgi:thiosulfate dehydrogenase [quinone] large subunit